MVTSTAMCRIAVGAQLTSVRLLPCEKAPLNGVHRPPICNDHLRQHRLVLRPGSRVHAGPCPRDRALAGAAALWRGRPKSGEPAAADICRAPAGPGELRASRAGVCPWTLLGPCIGHVPV